MKSDKEIEIPRDQNIIDLKYLPSLIRYHRKKAGVTQHELAKLAGVGKTVVFDIENGKRSIQLDTLGKIIEILNIQLTFQSPLMTQYLRDAHEKS